MPGGVRVGGFGPKAVLAEGRGWDLAEGSCFKEKVGVPGCWGVLGCGFWVHPTQPHALVPPPLVSPSFLSFYPSECLPVASVFLSAPGSLSRVSGPLLLSDSAALGPGHVLPTADPLVSLLCLPDPLWLLQNVPHKTSLPEGIRVGTVLRIRGLVPDKAGR